MALTTNVAVLLKCLKISRNATKVIFPSVSVSRHKHDSFKFSDLKIRLATSNQRLTKPDPSKLKFGEDFSDHMFKVEWNEDDGWGVPRILPLQYLDFPSGAKILHFVQGVFEGMKAFKYNEQVALFRPDMNMERLFVCSQRAALPSFDKEEFTKCLKKLVSIDKSWIPDCSGSSLYIRPTFIGRHQNTLGIHASSEALLFILTSPVSAYFATGQFTPVSLLAKPPYVRAWPGRVGDKKMATNYGPALHTQKVAQRQELHEVLWLFGEDHYITEAGGMNIFCLIKNASGDLELITPPLDGTILPGVMRRSVLDLTKKWDEFSVVERRITMKDVILANNEGRLVEMFSTGTVVCICPVGLIRYIGQDIKLPTPRHDSTISARLYKAVTDIQYGRVKSDWSVVIE